MSMGLGCVCVCVCVFFTVRSDVHMMAVLVYLAFSVSVQSSLAAPHSCVGGH